MPIASVATRNSTSPDWNRVDLGVAGARAERSHHHRRPAALAADQLGDGVDRVGGEGDDGAAPRQAGQLLGTGVGELAKTLAKLDVGLGAELADQRGHGRCAHQHGLRRAPRMQQPMREDVAAFRVGAELDFIDSQKLDFAIERHRLDSADEIARTGRDDLFFAGDQRDFIRAPRP